MHQSVNNINLCQSASQSAGGPINQCQSVCQLFHGAISQLGVQSGTIVKLVYLLVGQFLVSQSASRQSVV